MDNALGVIFSELKREIKEDANKHKHWPKLQEAMESVPHLESHIDELQKKADALESVGKKHDELVAKINEMEAMAEKPEPRQ